MTELLELKPVDTVTLRGNRLFADASHGDAVMPPWPSVLAGALRARILVDGGVGFEDFARREARNPEVARVVGPGPDQPGSFRVTCVGLAGPRFVEGGDGPEPTSERTGYFPLPADLVALRDGRGLRIERLVPVRAEELGGSSSNALPMVPVHRSAEPVKPVAGVWISAKGLAAHLRGEPVEAGAAVESKYLWLRDARLGIALDGATRTVLEGMLYTTETVALAPGVSFLVGVAGAEGVLPRDGLVRLGGDGRGAEVRACGALIDRANAPWAQRPRGDRFRIVLATPAVFEGGWLPTGVRPEGGSFVLTLGGLRARLVAAAVPRHEVVSGWDVSRNRPKPAVRVVPQGAVYWFERLEGPLDALETLAEGGLWPEKEIVPELAARRAEGFNNLWLGNWAEQARDQEG